MPRSQGARPEPYNDQKHRVQIPRIPKPTFDLRERSNYIKLHGSFNWDDGENAMLVLGGGKEEAIARFPLLRAYFDLFKQVLMTGNIRLLVTGYSFNDGHVNDTIAEAVRGAGLQLMIIDNFGTGSDSPNWEEFGTVSSITSADLPASSSRPTGV